VIWAGGQPWIVDLRRRSDRRNQADLGRRLQRSLKSFVDHYHEQRPHQGIGNRLIVPSNDEPPDGDRVVVDERLGGLLRSYRRAA
jgi:hypothetical protein